MVLDELKVELKKKEEEIGGVEKENVEKRVEMSHGVPVEQQTIYKP